MTTRAGTGQGQRRRPGLTRDHVLTTAVTLADAEGIAAVSMRRLGTALGVEPMAMYNHVANKDDLLDGMLEVVAQDIDALSPEGWRPRVRALCVAEHRALVKHPWAAPLWTARSGVGPARMAHVEHILEALERAALPADTEHQAFHTLANYVLGSILQQLGPTFDTAELMAISAGFLGGPRAQQYPRLARHIRSHMVPVEQPEATPSEFEFGLDLILDGLERSEPCS